LEPPEKSGKEAENYIYKIEYRIQNSESRRKDIKV
jgi:hypothetical protein